MASAYTPGLTVSSSTTIRKTRRLPLKGDVLVSAGSVVAPETVVARAALPGPLQTIRVASQLGVDAGDVPGALLVKIGDVVEPEILVARTSGLFGLFKSEVKAGVTGTVEIISPVSGNVGVRAASLPIDVTAYVPGTVIDVLPGEGVVVEARGAALIQGIFGIGGERRAPLARVAKTPNATLDADDLSDKHAGKAVVGGGRCHARGFAARGRNGRRGHRLRRHRGHGPCRVSGLRHRRRHHGPRGRSVHPRAHRGLR